MRYFLLLFMLVIATSCDREVKKNVKFESVNSSQEITYSGGAEVLSTSIGGVSFSIKPEGYKKYFIVKMSIKNDSGNTVVFGRDDVKITVLPIWAKDIASKSIRPDVFYRDYSSKFPASSKSELDYSYVNARNNGLEFNVSSMFKNLDGDLYLSSVNNPSVKITGNEETIEIFVRPKEVSFYSYNDIERMEGSNNVFFGTLFNSGMSTSGRIIDYDQNKIKDEDARETRGYIGALILDKDTIKNGQSLDRVAVLNVNNDGIFFMKISVNGKSETIIFSAKNIK